MSNPEMNEKEMRNLDRLKTKWQDTEEAKTINTLIE